MEEKVAMTSKGRMTYLVHGIGPTLLFLHGGFATPRAYIPLIELLGSRFTIVAPTHPGHGSSFAIDTRWRVEDVADSYAEFLHSIRAIPGVLFGHSLGGMLALLLAARGVGSRVIACDPPGVPFALNEKKSNKARLDELGEIIRQMQRKEHARTTLSAAGTVLYTSYKHPENVPWILQTIPRVDIRPEVQSLRIPVTLFWGADDGVVPVSVGEQFHRVIRGSTLAIFYGKRHQYPIVDPIFTYGEITKVI